MDAAHVVDRERTHVLDVTLHEVLEAVAHAEHVDAVEVATDRRRADDAVDAGCGAAADQDGEVLAVAHDVISEMPSSASGDDLEHLAALIDHVELTARVLAERGDAVDREAARWIGVGGTVGEVLRVAAAHARERADERRAIVGVEVRPAEIGHGAAAIDEAAGDRAALAVVVLE